MFKEIFLRFFLFFSYFFLIFTGFLFLFSHLWIRFIRNRLPRELPDMFLTEYSFWILMYICLIYLIIIISLIKPPTPTAFMKEIMEKLSFLKSSLLLPLKTVDELIKYNRRSKTIYYYFINFLSKNLVWHNKEMILILFYILPRFLLVLILFIDIFYFNAIKNFYALIIIGIFPLLLRYFKYSLNEICEKYVIEMQLYYDEIILFEEDFVWYWGRKFEKNAAPLHFEHVKIKEYIKIKYENMISWELNEVKYKYVGHPLSLDERYFEYQQEKYNDASTDLDSEDREFLRELFHRIMPQILAIKIYNEGFAYIESTTKFKICKIIIFCLYFICWFAVLNISYYYFPVDLSILKMMLKFFCNNLIRLQNPFI